jgi:queuosine biosynthesis protein QueD
MRAAVTKIFVFDAAHRLEIFGEGHKCARHHGHTFRAHITVEGEVDARGIVVDYYDIMAAWAPVQEALDHRYLNEVPGLEVPTTENLTRWVWQRLAPALTCPRYHLSKVTIFEGETDYCTFEGVL